MFSFMQTKTAEADWAIWCWPGGYASFVDKLSHTGPAIPINRDGFFFVHH